MTYVGSTGPVRHLELVSTGDGQVAAMTGNLSAEKFVGGCTLVAGVVVAASTASRQTR